MKKKLFLIAALAVAAAVAAWYVLRMDQGDGMAYLTEPVTIGNITRTVNATGEVGAVQLVSVGAQVGGQIKKLHVVLGQDVKKGDLIAEIDSVPQLIETIKKTDFGRLVETIKAVKEAGAVSFDTLKEICHAVSIPVVAIGGISAQNVLSLKGSGIDGVAVVSAIFAQPDVKAAAKIMHHLAKELVDA